MLQQCSTVAQGTISPNSGNISFNRMPAWQLTATNFIKPQTVLGSQSYPSACPTGLNKTLFTFNLTCPRRPNCWYNTISLEQSICIYYYLGPGAYLICVLVTLLAPWQLLLLFVIWACLCYVFCLLSICLLSLVSLSLVSVSVPV
jgi:hypothetical protein